MLSTTEETLEKIFNEAANRDNAVERVKKLRDYAFVHFRERQDAIIALNKMNGKSKKYFKCLFFILVRYDFFPTLY